MKKLLSFTAVTAIAAAIVLIAHFIIERFSSLPVQLTSADYIFITSLTLLTLYAAALLLRTFPKYVGAAYAGIGFLKLIVVGSWFLAYISDVSTQTKIYVLQFFAVYFFFQFVEVALLSKTLNKVKIKS